MHLSLGASFAAYASDAGVIIRERSPQAHRHADESPVENSLAVAFIAMPRRFRGSDRPRTLQRSIRSPRRISRRIPFTHVTRVRLDALGVPSIAFGRCRALRADTRVARIDRGGTTVALSSSLRWEALGASPAALLAHERLADPRDSHADPLRRSATGVLFFCARRS